MSAVIIPYPRPFQSRPLPVAVERRGRRPLVRIWVERIAERRTLAGLRPEQLRDVGLDPHAVRAEARKPFWRA